MEALQRKLVTDSFWVVEFSVSQKAFHLSSMTEMLQNNIRNVMDRRQTDYVVVGVFGDTNEADEYIQKCYEEIKNYSMFTAWNNQTIVV